MTIRLVPLGGLGEIGMNCLALEVGEPGRGALLIVDCGVMFPNAAIGVDVIHPDFHYLKAQRDRIAGVLVTHGHEDHIGGLPYLLREIDAPVYGPPYALGLIRERMKEHLAMDASVRRGLREPYLVPTRPRAPFSMRANGVDLEIEPIRVTHSIADATALAIRGDGALAIHTGDFKIDEAPADGEHFDRERLRALGDEGVTLLLSDSTNVDSPGSGRGEAVVAASLERLVRGAKGRVIVSLFASNVHRLRALGTIARANGRKLLMLGRSVQTHVRVAHDTGYLNLPPDLFVSLDDAQLVPRRELLVIATGSQAEPRAALSRLALDDHPKLRLEPGDTVILSSRAIPGNEVEVMRMVSDLHRRQCEVHIKATDPDVHASGHAHRDEQRAMIDLVRPGAFVPVHGTRHHLERHASLARSAGVRDVLVIENGEIADVDERGVIKTGVTQVGRIAVAEGLEIVESVLRDRRLLGELGVVAAAIHVDMAGRTRRTPVVAARGVVEESNRERVFREVADEVRTSLDAHPWTVAQPPEDELREVARLALRRAVARHVGYKPIALAIVVRGDER